MPTGATVVDIASRRDVTPKAAPPKLSKKTKSALDAYLENLPETSRPCVESGRHVDWRPQTARELKFPKGIEVGERCTCGVHRSQVINHRGHVIVPASYSEYPKGHRLPADADFSFADVRDALRLLKWVAVMERAAGQ